VIEVVSVAGLATVQDGGRTGRMHEGVPPGGALVRELLARANSALRNAPLEAGVEIFGQLTVLARSSVLVASDEGAPRWLHASQTWVIACRDARVRYLAVRGGIDVPVVLGGRGTLLFAGLGGYEGRALRRGDVLAAGRAVERDVPLAPTPDFESAIRVVPGPDLERFEARALEGLLGSRFHVSARSDRAGMRLVGPALPRSDGDLGISTPMVEGAIQVPASGEPIVLGPDHPTTGGYPVLATVVRPDLGALMGRAVGASVTFVRGG
jgi:biotin-dependent carboxylase-like uncharacterized protein